MLNSFRVMFCAILALVFASSVFAQEAPKRFSFSAKYLSGQSSTKTTFPANGPETINIWSRNIHQENGMGFATTFAVTSRVVIGFRAEVSNSVVHTNESFDRDSNGVPFEKPTRNQIQDRMKVKTPFAELSLSTPVFRNHSLILGAMYLAANETTRYGSPFGDSVTHSNQRFFGPVIGLSGKRGFKGFEVEYAGRIFPHLTEQEKTFGYWFDSMTGVRTDWSNPVVSKSGYGFELEGSLSRKLSSSFQLGGGYVCRNLYNPHKYENSGYESSEKFSQCTASTGLKFTK